MEKLQMWTNRVARHPVISRCDVFRHFLTCDEETVSQQQPEEQQ